MDLSLMATDVQSEEGTWMPVLDFDWQTEIGCSILVLGPDSKEAMAIADEEEKLNQRRLANTFVSKGKDTDKESPVDDGPAIRKAVRLTKGWKDVEWAGAPFPYTEGNAMILYTKAPHVRNQVLGYWRDRSHFTSPEYASWRKRFGEGSSSTTPAKAE